LSGGLFVNYLRDINAQMRVGDKDGDIMAHFDMFNKRTFLSGSQVTINRMSVHGGTDVNFFVSGTAGSRGSSVRGTSVFSGDLVTSGSVYLGASASQVLVVSSSLASDIIPDGDRTRNLGSESYRFANVYTGDLHLRNDRGDWTVIEEPDYLTVTNNRTGKRFKILMEPID
jgi:autotransporter adhesin